MKQFLSTLIYSFGLFYGQKTFDDKKYNCKVILNRNFFLVCKMRYSYYYAFSRFCNFKSRK